MKILLLPQYFYPESYASAHLDLDLYEYLASSGNQMVAFLPMPTRGINTEIKKEYLNKSKEELFEGHLIVHRFHLYGETSGTIQRALRYFLSAFIQFFKGLFVKDIDVILLVSTPPIIGFVGGLLHKLKRKPFVYVVQDIFPDSLIHTGIAKQNSLIWRIGHFIENFTYRNAAKIIVISQDFKTNLLAKNVSQDKIEVIYNWIDTTKIKPIPRGSNQLFTDWGLDSSFFYVVYAGNFGNAQSVDTIIKCAEILQSIPNIRFVLVGSGLQEQTLKQMVIDYELSNVVFFPLQSSEYLSNVYSLGNIGIVCCKKGFGHSSFPSKTWSYFAAGTPIIASYDLDSELSEIVSKNTLGMSIIPEDPEAMAKAIVSLKENKSLLQSMSLEVRTFAENHASKQKATKKYLEVLEKSIF